MAALERNVAPEDTQSQWVGEAAIKGKSQVTPNLSITSSPWFLDNKAGAIDDMSVWIAIYM